MNYIIQFATTVFNSVKYSMEGTPLKRSNNIFLHKRHQSSQILEDLQRIFLVSLNPTTLTKMTMGNLTKFKKIRTNNKRK